MKSMRYINDARWAADYGEPAVRRYGAAFGRRVVKFEDFLPAYLMRKSVTHSRIHLVFP